MRALTAEMSVHRAKNWCTLSPVSPEMGLLLYLHWAKLAYLSFVVLVRWIASL